MYMFMQQDVHCYALPILHWGAGADRTRSKQRTPLSA